MGDQQQHEFMNGDSDIRAHIEFYGPNPPTFQSLADLLRIILEQSTTYKIGGVRPTLMIMQVDCWHLTKLLKSRRRIAFFFTSVVQQVLSQNFECRLLTGTPGKQFYGRTVRKKIRKIFAARYG